MLKRLLHAAMVLATLQAFSPSALAQTPQSPAALQNYINQYITTNGQGKITGAILNTILGNIVASMCPILGSILSCPGVNGTPFSIAALVDDSAKCTNASVVGSNNQYSVMAGAVAATPAGGSLYIPQGIVFCTSPTIQIATGVKINLNGSTWRNGAANGTSAAPTVDILASATGAKILNGSFDFRANTGNFTDTAYFGANQPWGDIGISVQADNVELGQLMVSNGFDNCIGLATAITNVFQSGRPASPLVHDIVANNCGTGIHGGGGLGGPGKIGSSVDNGCASGAIIDRITDNASYGSFASDIGCGAWGSWSNIVSNSSQIDLITPGARNPAGLYVGAPNNAFSNVNINTPQGAYGLWDDFYASTPGTKRTVYANINITSANKTCVYEKSQSTWYGINCTNPSQSAAAGAVIIDVGSGAGVAGPINLQMYGVNVTPYTPLALMPGNFTGTGYGASASGTMTWSGAGCGTNPVLNVKTNGSGVITEVVSVATPGVCTVWPSGTTWSAGGGLSAGSGANFTYVPVLHAYSLQIINSDADHTVSGIITMGPPGGINAAWSGYPSAYTTGLTVLTNGSNGLGINSPNPQYPLDVVGEARFQTTSGNAGLEIYDQTSGHYAFMKVETATGIGQIGYEAGAAPGALQTVGLFGLQAYTIGAGSSQLPACTSSLNGMQAYVTDSGAPTYGSTATGGGSTRTRVMCLGASWLWE